MKDNSIDETIKKIKETLDENEYPLPKAAPTQPYVDSLSLRLSEESLESEASANIIMNRRSIDEIRQMVDMPSQQVTLELLHETAEPPEVETSVSVSLALENPEPECRARAYELLSRRTQSPSGWIAFQEPANLHELSQRLQGTPVLALHEVLPEGSYFTLRCRDCNFRFRSVENPLKLAHLHSNWNNHSVVFTLHVGEHKIEVETLPLAPSWDERYPYFSRVITRLSEKMSRFYRSLWCGGTCIFFLTWCAYYSLNASGFMRWWHFLMVMVWSHNIYRWWEHWKAYRKEKEK